MNPAFKTALVSGGLGLFGAGVADVAAHDPLDRSAGSLSEVRDHMEALPEQVQQVAIGTVGRAANPQIRALVMSALQGAPPEQILAALPGAPKDLKDLIKAAHEVSAVDPQLATAVIDVGMRMNAFDEEAGARGQEVRQVAEALNAGEAGESSLPAILGGAGLGTGGAILQHLLSKRAVRS